MIRSFHQPNAGLQRSECPLDLLPISLTSKSNLTYDWKSTLNMNSWCCLVQTYQSSHTTTDTTTTVLLEMEYRFHVVTSQVTVSGETTVTRPISFKNFVVVIPRETCLNQNCQDSRSQRVSMGTRGDRILPFVPSLANGATFSLLMEYSGYLWVRGREMCWLRVLAESTGNFQRKADMSCPCQALQSWLQ